MTASVPTPQPGNGALADRPNFTLLRAETWPTDAAEGEFLRHYAGKVNAYPSNYLDTKGRNAGTGSHYDPDNISVRDGVLAIHCRTGPDGKPGAANPYFINADGSLMAPQYGRFQVETWADAVPGYKRAFMGWPRTWAWTDGEIDFAEGSLTGTMEFFNHFPGDPSQHDGSSYHVDATQRHVYAVEFTPGGVEFFIDDTSVGISSGSHKGRSKVPTAGMFLNLQVETNLGDTQPGKDDDGFVYVGPTGIWAYTGA